MLLIVRTNVAMYKLSAPVSAKQGAELIVALCYAGMPPL